MVEVIGDIVMPSELIIPVTSTIPNMSGALILSGAKMWLNTGSGLEIVTSV